MLLPNDVTLRRDELKLHPKIIDALVASGAVASQKKDGVQHFAAADLERFFRDSLMQVYFAQANKPVVHVEPEREIEIEFEAEPAEERAPEITRTSDEHLAVAAVHADRPDLRLAARYVPRKQIGGMFREVKCVVLQLSNEGLRIRHSERLRPGDEARLSLALMNPAKSFAMRARVVWTSIAQRGDDPSFYISGLVVVANAERLGMVIDHLRTARELHLEEADRRRVARNIPRPVNGLADDDVVAIIRAVRKFAADPVEATRWYSRARFAIADEEVRRAAPRGAREREEVIGVWEYLQRRIDLRSVAGVVQWIRSSEVAAV